MCSFYYLYLPGKNPLNTWSLKCPNCDRGIPVPPSLVIVRVWRSHTYYSGWHQDHSTATVIRRASSSSFLVPFFFRLSSILCSSPLHWWKKPQRRNLSLMVSLSWRVLDSRPSVLWKSDWRSLKCALWLGETSFYQTIPHLAKVLKDFFKNAFSYFLLKQDSNAETVINPTC